MEALRIQRRAEIIGFTHWTIEELDAQDRDEVDRLLLYWRLKGDAEKERQGLDQASRSTRGRRR